jgi:hypothetical protein
VPSEDKIVVSTTSLAVDHGVQNNYQNLKYFTAGAGWSLRQIHTVAESKLHALGIPTLLYIVELLKIIRIACISR